MRIQIRLVFGSTKAGGGTPRPPAFLKASLKVNGSTSRSRFFRLSVGSLLIALRKIVLTSPTVKVFGGEGGTFSLPAAAGGLLVTDAGAAGAGSGSGAVGAGFGTDGAGASSGGRPGAASSPAAAPPRG